jgi:glutathione synthase/RimK-type ligase-like ATP-grasp enzyme
MSGKVYVIHDNPSWLPPFRAAFDAEGVPLEEWLLTEGAIDLSSEPPEGVFWSRLSASAHTRDRALSKDYGRAVLRWLSAWGRTVINGADVLEHVALQHAGIEVARTVAVLGTDGILERAAEFGAPFISKHNQGGKGLGVRRWDSVDEFAAWVDGPDFEPSPDGITLLQELLVAKAPFITRAEFVAGSLVYAVRVDTSAGSFELCPAEACAIPGADGAEPEPMFRRRDDVDPELVDRYLAFLAAEGIGIAGIEFIETRDGRTVTYDVNTNTNYNPDVEATAPRSGPREIARWLGSLLPQEVVGARG